MCHFTPVNSSSGVFCRFTGLSWLTLSSSNTMFSGSTIIKQFNIRFFDCKNNISRIYLGYRLSLLKVCLKNVHLEYIHGFSCIKFIPRVYLGSLVLNVYLLYLGSPFLNVHMKFISFSCIKCIPRVYLGSPVLNVYLEYIHGFSCIKCIPRVYLGSPELNV